MNYEKNYEKLISTRKFLHRKRMDDTYYESHHIIPRCLGGADNDSNLVLLTFKEHRLAHLLLTKMYKGVEKRKMCYAFWMMCRTTKNLQRTISTHEYISAKQLLSLANKGENNPNFGKHTSNETKLKMSKALKGRKFSEEHLKRMSLAQKGNTNFLGHNVTEEHRKKISDAKKGKKFTEKHKKKISDAKKGHPSWNKGLPISDETRKKLSENKKKYYQNKKLNEKARFCTN